MATKPAPSTPQSQFDKAAVSTPSPGSWQHPRFDEIARRQKASTFTESNLQRIAWNGGALLALCIASYYPWFQTITRHELIRPIRLPTLLLLYFLGLYNIAVALAPLVKAKDELADIPLTPTQRSLLGLDPRDTPSLTPGSQYSTPPRYPHSPTPRNMSPATRNNSVYSTPITRSPSFGREKSDSPTGTPAWQKAVGRTRDPARRSSYGSPSPLGPSIGGREGSVLGAPGTPSPTSGRGATVGLNSKWLYHKGRSSPGSRSMYSGSSIVG